MGGFIHFENGSLKIGQVTLLGVNATTGQALLFTVILIVGLWLLSYLLRTLAWAILRGRRQERIGFWVRQGIRLTMAILLVLGLLSIWFNNTANLATVLGLISAGLAFALQKVVTAVAGYFVILRGKTFNVGDRIVMGGVRGDVIDLGFVRTTIMEMGQPPPVQTDSPAMWVQARQYTGRIVTVTNDKIFDTPIYNYTREFPYIWEEMTLPVTFTADRRRAEQILLDAAAHHTVSVQQMSEEAIASMERRYTMSRVEMGPRVYYRITSNYLELTVRFIARDHGTREVKDAMSREILHALDEAGIGIASTTYDIVGLPPVRIQGATLSLTRTNGPQ